MRTVLITGASSGIGRALALHYAAMGDKVILVARDVEKLNEVAAEILACPPHSNPLPEGEKKFTVQIIMADLNDPASPQKIYDAISEPLDILINNAGLGCWGNFSSQDVNKLSSLIQVNISALMHLTHFFLPSMLARKQGKIVNIGSVYSYMPVPIQTVYAATKAFVLSFSLGLRDELKHSGLTVTAVCPGMTASAFRQRSGVQETGGRSQFFMMTAETVAEQIYSAVEARKAVFIPGWKNKLFIALVRYMPQRFLSAFVHWAVYTLRRVKPSTD
ncbi:MAG: SDR family NAD(P)-dependent oxidoreductase [Gammaproteobacteria bacterium]